MKKLAALLALGLAALPVSASHRVDGGTELTFYYVHTTANMTIYKDALFWRYDQLALDGAISVAARPNVSLGSIGGGNSELAISMALTPGNAWVTALAAINCPSASTDQQKRDCVDPLIKSDLKRLWQEYQKSLATPPPPPPDI